MPRPRSLAWALALLALPASAAAETPAAPPPADQPAPPAAPPAPPPAPPQGYAPPGYPPPGYPPPVYGQPPPGYGQPPPGYGPPVYGQGYEGEGPPPAPPKPEKLRWSLRFDPFDLLTRRLTFQAEVAIVGPFAIEIAPSWIFGSPATGLDRAGVSVAANAVFYLSGQPLRGLWLKAHFAYENYTATYTNPFDDTEALKSEPRRFGSAIIGAMFGDTFVIPKSGGFALSAGIGIGVATARKATLIAPGDAKRGVPAAETTLYDGFDRVRILGTLGLGVAF